MQPYRHHVGDLDFFIDPQEYSTLKQSLLDGIQIKGARIFPRTDLNMIELYDPDSDVLGITDIHPSCFVLRI